MVLRLLWLRSNDPDTWKMIDMLMDLLEDKETIQLNKTQKSVVEFIRKYCRLTQFSEEDIVHILGIVDTNSYIIGENPTKNVDLQGLYPVTSIINHSCVANTVCFAKEDFSFVCRAVTNIKEGEELTTNYLYYQYHFYGLSYRSSELQDFWHFKCTCERCQDPTELGTDCDSPIECQSNCDKVCTVCGLTMQARQVSNTVNQWWNVIQEVPSTDLTVCLDLLDQLGEVFSDNHYYVMEIKRRVIENIGSDGEFEYEDIAIKWLEQKVEFCNQHLALQKHLAPGMSEYRAYISLHLAEAMYWLYRKKYLVKKVTRDEVENTMEIVSELLLVVLDIWGLYRTDSNERMKADKAKTLLENVRREFLQTNSELVRIEFVFETLYLNTDNS